MIPLGMQKVFRLKKTSGFVKPLAENEKKTRACTNATQRLVRQVNVVEITEEALYLNLLKKNHYICSGEATSIIMEAYDLQIIAVEPKGKELQKCIDAKVTNINIFILNFQNCKSYDKMIYAILQIKILNYGISFHSISKYY